MPRNRISDFEKGLLTREADRADREAALSTAMKLLASGDKQAAARVLSSIGIDVGGMNTMPTPIDTGVRKPAPGETWVGGTANPLQSPTEQIRLETPADIAERVKRKEIEVNTSAEKERRESTRLSSDTAYFLDLMDRRRTGQATPEDLQTLNDIGTFVLTKSGRAPQGAEEALKERVFQELEKANGDLSQLNPFYRGYIEATVYKRNPELEQQRIELQGLRTQNEILKSQNDQAMRLRDLAGREEDRRGREADRGERTTDRRLSTVRTAIEGVQKRYERQREHIPLGANRQESMAQIDSQEQAEVQAIVDRYKKAYPNLSNEIDAFSPQTKRRPLADIFKEALK